MDTKKLKIKQVKVYQSVKFEGAENSYFTPSQYMSVRSSKPNVQIEEGEHGSVIIRSDKDMIKIGANNVAFIQYDMESEDVKEQKQEKELFEKKPRK